MMALFKAMSWLKPRDLPNLISIARLVAVIPVVFLLIRHEFGWALLWFSIAGLSDGIDGYLAKRYGWQSRIGGLLDPLADKVLLVCCFLVLGAENLIPLWLVLIAISRDLIIVSGALLYHYGIGEIEPRPLLSSKINTAVQIALVVAVILDTGIWDLPAPLISTLIWICLFTTVFSGAQYVWIWGRKAMAEAGRRD